MQVPATDAAPASVHEFSCEATEQTLQAALAENGHLRRQQNCAAAQVREAQAEAQDAAEAQQLAEQACTSAEDRADNAETRAAAAEAKATAAEARARTAEERAAAAESRAASADRRAVQAEQAQTAWDRHIEDKLAISMALQKANDGLRVTNASLQAQLDRLSAANTSPQQLHVSSQGSNNYPLCPAGHDAGCQTDDDSSATDSESSHLPARAPLACQQHQQ